jgi:uncharacterized protein (TIGR03083 family)
MEPAIIDTLPLFPELDRLLLELLRGLRPADWELPTVAGHWRVRDVALHLLDGNLRSVSMLRDGHFAGPGPASAAPADVVVYLNQLNQSWVAATQRLSPAVLIELLAHSGPPYYEHLGTLDPLAPATFAVGWAGEAESANWFHIARDYTERWHHQQQIRHAVGQEAALYQPALYRPYLATSVRALPHRLHHVAAAPGERVRFEVMGPGGGCWVLHREPAGWALSLAADADASGAPARAHVKVAEPVAWRLFSKNISLADALPFVELTGDQQLGQWLLGAVAVMA